MVLRRDIVKAARSWIGERWRHQQHKRGVGCDCIGHVVESLGEAGFVPAQNYPYPPYIRNPKTDVELEDVVSVHLVKKPIPDMKPGDVCLISWKSFPTHLAIVGDHPCGGLSLIHSLLVPGRVAEHFLSADWRARIVAVYEVPGVE